MARTIESVRTEVDALRRAIGSGARRVEFGSGTTRHVTEYRSLDEMRTALSLLEAEISSLSGAGGAGRISYIEHGSDR